MGRHGHRCQRSVSTHHDGRRPIDNSRVQQFLGLPQYTRWCTFVRCQYCSNTTGMYSPSCVCFFLPPLPCSSFLPLCKRSRQIQRSSLGFLHPFSSYLMSPNRILSPGLLQMSAQRVMRSFPSLLPSISTRSPMDVNTTSSSSLPTPSYSTSTLTVFMRRQKMVSMVSFLSHQHRT